MDGKMQGVSKLVPWRKGIPKWLKQTSIMLTIMGLSSFTAASSTVLRLYPYEGLYRIPGFLLMLILTEFLGRKRLFMALFTLSILTSIFYVADLKYISRITLAPIDGATIALTSIVMYEYCDPKNRIVFLVSNAFVYKLTYWATVICHRDFSDFGMYTHYSGLGLGVLCLASVFTWPESPYWLASKKRFDECKQAFVSIRSEKSQQSAELPALTKGPRYGSFKMVFIPILTASLVLQLKTCLRYVEEVLFDKIGDSVLEGHKLFVFSIILCFVVFTSTVTITFASLKTSRRELFLLTSTCVNIFNINLLEDAERVFALKLFLFLVLSLSVVCVSSAITFPIIIETIPQKYGNLLMTIITSMFIMLEFSDYVYDVTFDLFTILPSANTFFFVFSVIIYFIMPETKEKTLLEIEQSYLPERKQCLPNIQTQL